MSIRKDVSPGCRPAALIASASLVVIWLCARSPTASGQNEPISPATPSKYPAVTRENVESRRKDALASKDLDDTTRPKALDFYHQADEALKAAEAHSDKIAESKRLADRAARVADETKGELKRLRETGGRAEGDKAAPATGSSAATPPGSDNRSSAGLETDLVEARASLERLAKQQADLEKEPNRRANRRKDIGARLLAAPDQIVDLKKQRAGAAPQDEPAPMTLARRTSIQAQIQCLDREVPALRAELARYDAEDAVDLVRLQRDVSAQRLAVGDRRVKVLTESLDRARRAEAERALAEARRMEVEAPPLLQSYAAENTKLAEEARSLTKPIEAVEKELKHAKAALENLTEQFTKTKQKADGVGLTGPIGQLLRKQRAALPDPLVYQRSVDGRSQTIDEVQFRLYELDENRSNAADSEPIIRTISAQAPAGFSAEQRELLVKASQQMLESKRQYLDVLGRNYNNYFSTLLDLVVTQHKLIEVIDKYADYIDERVLWIRSSRPLMLREVFRGKPIGWLVSPANWKQVIEAIVSDTKANALAPFGLAVLVGFFWYMRKRFGREIAKLGHDAHRANFTRFLPTLRAFGLTVLTSSAGGAIPCYVAWRLWVAAYEIDFPSAVSDGLFLAAWLFFPLDVVRRSCRRDGLAESHFGWSPGTLSTVARDVRWLIFIGVPITFVMQLLHSSDADSLRNALERVLFVSGMVAISVFVYRVLRPHSDVLWEVVKSEHEDWPERLRFLCRWAGVGGPLVIVALVVAGYDYTARQFVWRIYLTGVALLSGYYTRALFLRWILIHRRVMGMRQVKERRVTELRSTVVADPNVSAAVHTEPVPKIDLATLSAQTRNIVNVGILTSFLLGCWWIWADMFPSMGILTRFELWPTTVGDHVESVTVGNLLSAVLVAAMTWVAVRNIPGLLEMTVLQRLPLDTAGRFAFSTLARYAMVIVGMVWASSSIGIGWSKVQWLATALTFGLAFGLQEIFANFIAGLIILFERPVRVGDMVTIEKVTGIVSRIRIRATTIVNSDRKEFIVPNKEFITGRLLNWTLSDTINRIVINVRVAYGSDTELAQELLLKAAHDHPAVLRDPSPSASFEEFGKASLRLVLRCFLPNLSERTRVIHELHTAINKTFAAHGIKIPVPKSESLAKHKLPVVGPKKIDSPRDEAEHEAA